MRRPESDLHTTSEGPLVRSFGTLPSVWSGKYANRSAWPNAEAGIRMAMTSMAKGRAGQRTICETYNASAACAAATRAIGTRYGEQLT